MNQPALEMAIESHRSELTGYCRRMLGSQFDAEDAVQETLLRAWRSADRLQQPAALRSWLYRIAGNVCIDSVSRRARHPIPTDEPCEPLDPGADLDPAHVALSREDLQVALAAVMHCLPPRQRAVLLLREILCWPSADVADLLATSVAAVNSALQRAHATLSRHELDRLAPPEDEAQHGLVSSYLTAFEADDIDALTALSRREATRQACAN